MLTYSKRNPPSGYYVYAYLRNTDSDIAKAGTPYYIGKGKGARAFSDHKQLPVPKDNSNIVILEQNLTELGAFAIERRMIKWYGKIIDGSGILRNRVDGGNGGGWPKGMPYPESAKQKLRVPNDKKALPGKLNGMWCKTHTDVVKANLALIPVLHLKGKTYEEINGVERATQLKQDRSIKLKTYIKNTPGCRDGKNNANAKSYKFIDPTGATHIIHGEFKTFCRAHKLEFGAAINCAKGRRASYKGWTIHYC